MIEQRPEVDALDALEAIDEHTSLLHPPPTPPLGSASSSSSSSSSSSLSITTAEAISRIVKPQNNFHPRQDEESRATSLTDDDSLYHRDLSPSSDSTLSHPDRNHRDHHPHHLSGGQWRQNLVLLLAVFLVNSDSAILLAMFRQIASDFDKLSSASWIITSYIIGVIVTQPLFGKLSDIYGRKPMLIIAYVFYILGGVLAGAGFAFWGVLLGRGLCGVGNAGITVLISTLIVDLVPIREVAVWRGYVYAINQVGRAIGPSLGGIISDTFNWRWSLLYQVPLNTFGLLFIWWKMSFPSPSSPPSSPSASSTPSASSGTGGAKSKLKRIDFPGSLTLGLSNVSLLLLLDRIQHLPTSSSTSPSQQENLSLTTFLRDAYTITTLSLWLLSLTAFLLVESLWAREPILPLRLLFLTRNVLSSYAIQFLQTVAQMALFTSLPLYFRLVNGDSSVKVAMRLLFITVGTVLGGLVSGVVIKRTGLYKLVIVVAVVLSDASFGAIYWRWRGGSGHGMGTGTGTSWWETGYGFPVGVGFGVSLSAAFIGLTAALESKPGQGGSQVAVATSGFYLSLNLGSLFGVSGASLIISSVVEKTLRKELDGVPGGRDVIKEVMSNIDKIGELPDWLGDLVKGAYTRSFVYVWLYALVAGCLALGASFIMKEGQLKDSQLSHPPPARKKRGSRPGTGRQEERVQRIGYGTFGGGQNRNSEEESPVAHSG